MFPSFRKATPELCSGLLHTSLPQHLCRVSCDCMVPVHPLAGSANGWTNKQAGIWRELGYGGIPLAPFPISNLSSASNVGILNRIQLVLPVSLLVGFPEMELCRSPSCLGDDLLDVLAVIIRQRPAKALHENAACRREISKDLWTKKGVGQNLAAGDTQVLPFHLPRFHFGPHTQKGKPKG